MRDQRDVSSNGKMVEELHDLNLELETLHEAVCCFLEKFDDPDADEELDECLERLRDLTEARDAEPSV